MAAVNIKFGDDWILKQMSGKPLGLLGLKFKDGAGKEYVWWPKWDNVRFIYFLSTVTEWQNEGPFKWAETKKFIGEAQQIVASIRSWAEDSLKEQQAKLKQLIEQGKFREAATILSSDLLQVADWVAQKNSVSQ